MTDRLQPILDSKRSTVAARKAVRPTESLNPHAFGPPRGFAAALLAHRAAGTFGLIAEIKKASPSKGLIRADFNPESHARAYAAGGAACLSVLTDEPYFQGNDAFVAQARAAATLPILRKEFILDPYQILELRAIGADAILLIVAALTDAELAEYEQRASDLGLDVLIEVHDEAELERALKLKTPLIGINNRNLKTMAVDLATCETLAAQVPADRLVVGELGIATHTELQRLQQAGITIFLVGELLMRETDVEAATRRLLTGA